MVIESDLAAENGVSVALDQKRQACLFFSLKLLICMLRSWKPHLKGLVRNVIRFPQIFLDFLKKKSEISPRVFSGRLGCWYDPQLSTEGSRTHYTTIMECRPPEAARDWHVDLDKACSIETLENYWFDQFLIEFFRGSKWEWCQFDPIACSNPRFDIRNQIFVRFGPLDSSVSFLIWQLNRDELTLAFF